MLNQIFIDNYRTLVNFELPLGKIALLLGANGSGKSSVFDVLMTLKEFIGGAGRVAGAFIRDSLTRWQLSSVQRFGLDVTIGGKKYQYRLEIEHETDRRLSRVRKELLLLEDRPLFTFENGTALLYRDDFSKEAEYPFDWSQSGLSAIHSRPENQLITQFKEWMERMIIVRPVPSLMTGESTEEHTHLSLSAHNFSSWYRYLSQEHQSMVFELIKTLRDVLNGFHSFRLIRTGENHRTLMAGFYKSDTDEPVFYRFQDLSDGQRILILLYTLLFYMKEQSVCLCIDEPENYLALPEIQPLLANIVDEVSEGHGQILLISHHPEIINYMATGYGWWFDQSVGSPVRLQKITPDGSGLPISELVARGWIYE